MIVLNKVLDLDISTINCYFQPLEKVLFLDIETTGFSYYKNQLFLIGCIYIKNNTLNLIQWFAEDEEDEYVILHEYINFSMSFEKIVHYNGDTFDLPFIRNKAKLYKRSVNSQIISYDIYKKIKPYKSIIGLIDCKLKSVEKFLNIERTDIYSGKDVANQYRTYLQTHSEELVNTMITHNEEDLIGLLSILHILDYSTFCEGLSNQLIDYKMEKSSFMDDHIKIILRLEKESPIDNIMTKDNYWIQISKDKIIIQTTLYTGELKHFFDNYKDYYFIISEDQAMHKSVAMYVDPSNRKKANARNCYIKRRGKFLPLPLRFKTQETLFTDQYNSSIRYVEINESLINNNRFINEYVNHLLVTL